jgi:molecular chaperone GrpE
VSDREPRPGDPGAEPTPEPGAAPGVESEAPAESAADATLPNATELRDRWLRAEADLQNYRRRAQREREEARRTAEESVLLELVQVLDDLERALESAPDSGVPDAWLQGVKLVASRALEGLNRFGVSVVDPQGERFDPAFHEALLEIEAPAGVPPGTVTQVVHKGYARGGRALRAARVVVARAGGEGAH